jgi:hypothetical protein
MSRQPTHQCLCLVRFMTCPMQGFLTKQIVEVIMGGTRFMSWIRLLAILTNILCDFPWSPDSALIVPRS